MTTNGWSSLRGPTAHFSHQYGECSAWARWWPREVEPGGAQLGRQLGGGVDADVAAFGDAGRGTRRDSIQLIFSGNHAGTVAGERAARLEHPHHLGDRRDVVLDVLEHLAR